jgi:hypothetical protein
MLAPPVTSGAPPRRHRARAKPQGVGGRDNRADEREQRASEGEQGGDTAHDKHRGELESEHGAHKQGGHRETHTQRTGKTQSNGPVDQPGAA